MLLQRFLCNISSPVTVTSVNSVSFPLCKRRMRLPPRVKLSPASSFFSELQDLLFYIASFPHDLIFMGDFNLPIESSSSDVRQLTGILESFDLNQYVSCPTHAHVHSLHGKVFLKGVNFCPYHRLMPFLIPFLLFLISKYLQTIITLYRKPSL